MQNHSNVHGHRFSKFGMFALVLVGGPVMMGASCSTTLLSVTEPLSANVTLASLQQAGVPASVMSAICGAGPDAFIFRTFNVAAGQTVFAEAVGPTTNSRPQILAFSQTTGSLLAASSNNPTLQNATLSFVPTSAETIGFLVTECGTVTAATATSSPYNVLVQQ